MTEKQKNCWLETWDTIKSYNQITLWGSKHDGWANIRYKQKQNRIDYTMKPYLISKIMMELIENSRIQKPTSNTHPKKINP